MYWDNAVGVNAALAADAGRRFAAEVAVVVDELVDVAAEVALDKRPNTWRP